MSNPTPAATIKETLTRSVNLTNPEILLLDGQCSAKVQGIVDQVKAEEAMRSDFAALPQGQADWALRVASKAIENGILESSFVRMERSWCDCCDRRAGYALYKRSGRNHRKGDEDRSKPLILTGGAHLPGGGFACSTCWVAIKPVLLEAIAKHPVEISSAWPFYGTPSPWKKSPNKECTKCNWTGHERQLGRLRTLMGDGFYYGKCPSCGVENHLFSHTIKTVDGFVMVRGGAK